MTLHLVVYLEVLVLLRNILITYYFAITQKLLKNYFLSMILWPFFAGTT